MCGAEIANAAARAKKNVVNLFAVRVAEKPNQM